MNNKKGLLGLTVVSTETRNKFIHSVNNSCIYQDSLDHCDDKKNPGSQGLKIRNVSFWFTVRLDQRTSEKLSTQQNHSGTHTEKEASQHLPEHWKSLL